MHNVFSKSIYLLRDTGHRPPRQTDQARHRTQTAPSDLPGKTQDTDRHVRPTRQDIGHTQSDVQPTGQEFLEFNVPSVVQDHLRNQVADQRTQTTSDTTVYTMK